MASLLTLAHRLERETGFQGGRLKAITFMDAATKAKSAGEAERQAYFEKCYREELDKLDGEGVSDVVGFIADRAGIKPEPMPDF